MRPEPISVPPLLGVIPTVFYGATFATYMIYEWRLDPAWLQAAAWINFASLMGALVVAIPDFRPLAALSAAPSSPVHKRGVRYLVFYWTAFLIFSLTAYLEIGNQGAEMPDARAAVFLTGIGFMCATAATVAGFEVGHEHKPD